MRTFAVSYLVVGAAFYVANGIGHVLWPSHSFSWRVAGQLALLVVAVAFLGLVFALYPPSRRMPLVASIGAALGVIHLFPLYLELAGRFVWEPVGPRPSGVEFLLMFAGNLVLPVVTFSGSAYDGTFLTIPATVIVLVLVGTTFRAYRRGHVAAV